MMISRSFLPPPKPKIRLCDFGIGYAKWSCFGNPDVMCMEVVRGFGPTPKEAYDNFMGIVKKHWKCRGCL